MMNWILNFSVLTVDKPGRKITFVLLIIILQLIIFGSESPGREMSYQPGEMIVQLQKSVGPGQADKTLRAMKLTPERLLSRRLNIWLCNFSQNAVSSESALTAAWANPAVLNAQFNHFVTLRSTIPNDPRFDSQWYLNNIGQSGGVPDADLDAPEAWDFSTDGITAGGDEIVIAIIDDGFDLNHSDLDFWKNSQEIPGNGIDDDHNGYVDDYDGWNAYNSNGFIPNGSHGTHVAGIAAAIGNNDNGISGVNWHTKILPIAGSSATEAVVIEAYGYALELRARYNETRGDSGAFVVVTNSSFGIDYGKPADYPLWCAMYDSLGAYGILNCAATANMNIDVDVEGDIPTSCTSNWLITATNTTRYDTRNHGAAYGYESIDLGAPGTSILSTVPTNSYGFKTGTSMASPVVAGTVALLFSAASSNLMKAYKKNPKNMALLFKEYVLSGTDSLQGLAGITSTGGRVNLFNSLQLARLYPDSTDPDPPKNFKAYSNYFAPNFIHLTWQDPTNFAGGDTLLPQEFRIIIQRDGLVIDLVEGGNGEYFDQDLTDGQFYEYEIASRILRTDSLSLPVKTGWTAGGARKPSPPRNFYLTFGQNSRLLAHWTNPSVNIDGTPMDDFSGVKFFEDRKLLETFSRLPGDSGKVDSSEFVPTTGIHNYYLTAFDNETPVFDSDAGNLNFTPIRLPVLDEFLYPGEPAAEFWLNSGSQVTDLGVQPPSPPNVLSLDGFPSGADSLTLLPVDLRFLPDSDLVISYWYQPQGLGDAPENEDSLLLEFKDGDDHWRLIKSYAGTGNQPFTHEVLSLDSLLLALGDSFLRPDFQLRFRNLTSGNRISHYDQWLIDDFYFGAANSNPEMVVTPLQLSDTLSPGADDSLTIWVKNDQAAPSLLNFSAFVYPETPWLQVFPDSGRLASREKINLAVLVRSVNLASGGHQAQLIISGNDSGNTRDTVKVFLHVLENPKIRISADSILFDTLFTGQVAVETFNIRNLTSDSLRIKLAGADSTVFHPDTARFLLSPHDSVSLPIKFAPLKKGFYRDWLHIFTNSEVSPIDSILLIGSAVGPPQISVYPILVNLSLAEGDSSDFTLKISNSGESDLIWQAAIGSEKNAGLSADSSQLLHFLEIIPPRSGVIAPGEESGLDLRIFGVSSGVDTPKAVVAIESNDPVSPEIKITVMLNVVSSLGPDVGLPKTWSLEPNFPNPFNPETTIKFQVPRTAVVKIMIYNILGEKVLELENKQFAPGFYRIVWNGRNQRGEQVASGLYILRFESREYTRIRKMLLMR